MPGQSVALTNERTGTCPLARIRGRPRSSLAQIACVFVAAIIKQLQGPVVFKCQEGQHSKTACCLFFVPSTYKVPTITTSACTPRPPQRSDDVLPKPPRLRY